MCNYCFALRSRDPSWKYAATFKYCIRRNTYRNNVWWATGYTIFTEYLSCKFHSLCTKCVCTKASDTHLWINIETHLVPSVTVLLFSQFRSIPNLGSSFSLFCFREYLLSPFYLCNLKVNSKREPNLFILSSGLTLAHIIVISIQEGLKNVYWMNKWIACAKALSWESTGYIMGGLKTTVPKSTFASWNNSSYVSPWLQG